mgnify:CR=1 FL=1
MIQPKTPKKIKGARKKRRAQEKEKEKEKSEDTGIYKHGDTLYIKQEVLNSYLEAELIKSGIKYYIIPEPLCEYAVPGKEVSENYPFPYKCGVMYECRYKHPTQRITENCPRRQIGNIRKEKRHEQRSGAYKRD